MDQSSHITLTTKDGKVIPIVEDELTPYDEADQHKQIVEERDSSTCALGRSNRVHTSRKADSMHDDNQKDGEVVSLGIFGITHNNGVPVPDKIKELGKKDIKRLKVEAFTYHLMQSPNTWMQIRPIIAKFPDGYKVPITNVSAFVVQAKKVEGFVHYKQEGGSRVWWAKFNPTSFRRKEFASKNGSESRAQKRIDYVTNEMRQYTEWTIYKNFANATPDELGLQAGNAQFLFRIRMENVFKRDIQWKKEGRGWMFKYVGNETYIPPETDDKIETKANTDNDNHVSTDKETIAEASPAAHEQGLKEESTTIVKTIPSLFGIPFPKLLRMGAAAFIAMADESEKP